MVSRRPPRNPPQQPPQPANNPLLSLSRLEPSQEIDHTRKHLQTHTSLPGMVQEVGIHDFLQLRQRSHGLQAGGAR